LLIQGFDRAPFNIFRSFPGQVYIIELLFSLGYNRFVSADIEIDFFAVLQIARLVPAFVQKGSSLLIGTHIMKVINMAEWKGDYCLFMPVRLSMLSIPPVTRHLKTILTVYLQGSSFPDLEFF